MAKINRIPVDALSIPEQMDHLAWLTNNIITLQEYKMSSQVVTRGQKSRIDAIILEMKTVMKDISNNIKSMAQTIGDKSLNQFNQVK
jgi:hypothetical protein